MSSLRRLADSSDPDSLANRLRARRFRLFEELLGRLPRPVRIVDVGGTTDFWSQRGLAGAEGVHVTLVNLEGEERAHANVVPTVGDATRLDFADGSFDVAFSNSVIEHLTTFENQLAMGREVERVARAHWVQTPNFWFPIEPHFLVPGWQWLPEGTRVALLRRRRCGWRGPCPRPADARAAVREVRLLSRRELRRIFPASRLIPERFAGLVKSWTAVAGFPDARPGGAA